MKYLTNDASIYLSSDDNGLLFTASARLVESFLSRMMGNYFFKMYPMKSPTKLFTNKDEAIKWLLQFK